jgi:hypothetical protein
VSLGMRCLLDLPLLLRSPSPEKPLVRQDIGRRREPAPHGERAIDVRLDGDELTVDAYDGEAGHVSRTYIVLGSSS